MKLICNSFTAKNPNATFKVIGKYKGRHEYMAEASHDGMLYVLDIQTDKVNISKIGYIGIVTTTDFTIVK